MKMQIDISGQVQQRNYDSALAFKRSDGIEKTVFLRAKTKKALLSKYKGQIINPIEKIHCILIYYCIKDYLKGVEEIKICKDVNFRRTKRLIPNLFKEHKNFPSIKIISRSGGEPKSNGHKPALKAFRKRKYANLIISKEMIEKKLLEFK